MLRITLHINANLLQDWEVRNVGGSRDGFHLYEVRPIVDGTVPDRPTLTVVHRRSDGAEALAATVFRALDVHGKPRC